MSEVTIPLVDLPILGSTPAPSTPVGLEGITLNRDERISIALDLYKFEASMKLQLLGAFNGKLSEAKTCLHWILEGRPDVG